MLKISEKQRGVLVKQLISEMGKQALGSLVAQRGQIRGSCVVVHTQ